MVGLEYVLLHVQEPILYVIRKQHRHSHQQVTPLADYYIIAGVVYQAPDLASVLNSRLVRLFYIFIIVNLTSRNEFSLTNDILNRFASFNALLL